MGIIQRQGIKNSIAQYLGAGIGVLSTLFVYNEANEVHGLVQYLKSTALLFLPLANWGIQSLAIRFFPNFKTESNKHHGFLSFLLLASSLVFFVFAALVFFFWDEVQTYLLPTSDQTPLIPIYSWYFIPLMYLLILVNTLTYYISNFQRIVVPGILHHVFLKLVVPILILLYIADYVSVDWIVRIFVLAYLFIVCFLLYYLYHLGQLNLSMPHKKVWGQLNTMADYAGFSMLGSLGAMFALQLDIFMLGKFGTELATQIGKLDTETQISIYSQAIFIATAISIPQRSLISISAPLIADSWQKDDRQHIGQLYRQISGVLLIVGLFLLLEIIFNFTDLCALLPKGDRLLLALPIIGILGISQVIDMGTSANGHIIQYSVKYRINTYFILFLGLLNIVLNLILVPRYQMMGAAVATAFSLTTYNIIRTFYVYYRFGMHPFSSNTLRLLVITAISIAVAYFLPSSSMALLNLAYRGLLIAIVFMIPVYFWKISPEFNQYVDDAWEKIKVSFGKRGG